MKKSRLVRLQDEKVILEQCSITESFIERFQGLMGKKKLNHNEGIIIDHCNSIHTFFMNFPIDVVYLSHEGQIVKITKNFKPWRVGLPVWRASSVLEMAVGGAEHLNLGDILCLN